MTIRKSGLGILLMALAAGSALAQGAVAGGDPPSRVARVNFLSGPVSFRPGSVEDWTAAALNYPLTTGDHLWADADARAEIHIGSTAIRLDSMTAMSVLALDDTVAQLSLTEGTINVRLRFLDPGDTFEVDTPNASIVLRRVGDYRISARGDDNISMLAVRGGEALVHAGTDAGFPVLTGQSVRLMGQDHVTQEMGGVPGPDGFDQWCLTRDRREASMVSARYVPREMIGYEDLDEHGVWREDPRLGWVWTPRGMAVGWAPYHYGHWAWVEPWGWTWIDDAPWGFAPFHYGRWAFSGGLWVWAPGRMDAAIGVVRVRPVYAPALVAFVGGGGFSVSVGVGGGGMAAWFPLGPGEVYRPAYRVSDRYVENINIVHVSNVTVIRETNFTNVRYVNQSVQGATMVVSHDAFVGSRRVSEVAIVVPHEQIMRAQVVGSTAMVAPVRASVIGHADGAVVVVHAPPARFAERTVVVAHQPPPPPVSFAAKEQMLRSNGGRPLDTNQMNTVRPSAPSHPMVRNTTTPTGGGGNPRPEVTRPPNNDRPQNARPPINPGQPPVRPPAEPTRTNEQRTPEARPAEARPVERKTEEPKPAPKPEEKKSPPPKKGDRTQKKG